MNQALDVASLLKGMAFMADLGLSEHDELRQAIGGVVVATANLDFRQGLISPADHAEVLARVKELSPVPAQTH